jgi:hypothetical protein
MLTTFALVAVIMFSADALGPRLSGIVSTYPAMVTVVGAFTHHQWGRDAVRGLLRGLTVSLMVFVVFFLAVGIGLPTLGLLPSFACATALVLCIDGILLLLMRRQRSG